VEGIVKKKKKNKQVGNRNSFIVEFANPKFPLSLALANKRERIFFFFVFETKLKMKKKTKSIFFPSLPYSPIPIPTDPPPTPLFYCRISFTWKKHNVKLNGNGNKIKKLNLFSFYYSAVPRSYFENVK
jgi:hypothetical protein